MNPETARWKTLLCLALLLGTGAALAGPPLVCHPLDAGRAALLPWGGSANWYSPDPSYDATGLTRDVLHLLAGEPPPLARMENLRRAAIYGSDHPEAGIALIETLIARAAAGPQHAAAWFDAAYLIETNRQLTTVRRGNLLVDVRVPPTGWVELRRLDGVRMLETLQSHGGDSAAVQFALSMMARDAGGARAHWQQAAALAGNDALLSANLDRFRYW